MRPYAHLEFAHIYADEAFGMEQAESLVHARSIVADLERRGLSFVATALIDDANCRRVAFDAPAFTSRVRAAGLPLSALAWESRLASAAETILEALPRSRLRRETFRKAGRSVLTFKDDAGGRIGIRTEGAGEARYSCALLSCAWTLCRLGLRSFPPGSLTVLDGAVGSAETAISVLPARYAPTERKVLTLMDAAGHGDALARVRHVFFDAACAPAVRTKDAVPFGASELCMEII